MNAVSNLSKAIAQRIEELHAVAPGSIGDQMSYRLIDSDDVLGVYTFSCKTMDWMRNGPGTLHGGMCATVVDQAMGFVAYCAKPGQGTAPTVSMQVTYHRPFIPGEDILVKVRVLTVTKSLMHFSAEAMRFSQPDKLCLTSSATYFYKANGD